MLIHRQEEHKLIEKKTVCSTERERERTILERERGGKNKDGM